MVYTLHHYAEDSAAGIPSATSIPSVISVFYGTMTATGPFRLIVTSSFSLVRRVATVNSIGLFEQSVVMLERLLPLYKMRSDQIEFYIS